MNFGKNILEYMKKMEFRIRALNIVYIEGVNPDTFKLNGDKFDRWNDVRMIIRDNGEILLCNSATIEPGAYYTFNRMNKKGAARIYLGENNIGAQYKDAWTFGLHGKSRQNALVQCGNITVSRDCNEDGTRCGDRLDTGKYFGINQHTTSWSFVKQFNFRNLNDVQSKSISFWSAGCAVGLHPASHAKFMQINKDSGRKVFDSTFLAGTVLKEKGII